MRKTMEDRFWEKVGPHDDPAKCWLWTACSTHSSKLKYGIFTVQWKTGWKMTLAHRLSYEMYHGITLSPNTVVYHVAPSRHTNTLCVNPHHLKAVPRHLYVNHAHPKMKRTIEERFWSKVGEHTDPNACWLWVGCSVKSSNGHLLYGQLRTNGRRIQAHRFSYELHYGVKVPPDMTIDHVKARGCASTLCVNPHHLEIVTNKTNILRGDGPTARNARRASCIHGHPFNKENTYERSTGGRDCRACSRERNSKTKGGGGLTHTS